MLGLIKKDILLMKSNLKSMIIILIVYLIMAFQGTFDITFIVPFIGIIMFISTFSYDEYNNWNAYAVTLPNGRVNVVKAKYISSIILIIILGILSLATAILIGYIKKDIINFDEISSSLVGTLISCVLIISVLYPSILKYGATNGKIILFVVVFSITGIGALIARFVDMSYITKILEEIDKYSIIAIIIIPMLLLGISYLISNKIYKNKEF